MQAIDYQHLPDSFVPEGMEIMKNTRVKRGKSVGFDERTREDRKKARDVARLKAADARRAKVEALSLL